VECREGAPASVDYGMRRWWAWGPLLMIAVPAWAAEEGPVATTAIVQIVGIVVPVVGTLVLAWFNLRAGQKATEAKVAEVQTRAVELDKKVDAVKVDVAQVHEATNGLSHRLAEAAGQAGFGKGQAQERRDERLRAAEAAVAVGPIAVAVPAPAVAIMALPEASTDRLEMLKKIEAMLVEFHKLPPDDPGPQ